MSATGCRSGSGGYGASVRRGLAFLVLAVSLSGCGLHARGPAAYIPATPVAVTAVPGRVPEVRCAGAPAAGPRRGFRRWRDRVIGALAHPDHHGDDLIAAAGEDQVIEGKLAYGFADKAVENEDVDLFACTAAGWQRIGDTRSDGEGRFRLELHGAARLPVGLRDLYASVAGDRSGVAFLAYVAPAGSPIVVTDVDGTLTAGENAFPHAVILGGGVSAQPGAAAALAAAPAQVVYVTARGERFTEATRRWLGAHGFPRGPLVLGRGLFVKPGAATVAYKTRVLRALARDFTIVAGVGNRASDVAAYSAAGVPASRIFIKLPEFVGEVARALHEHRAVGFAAYGSLVF